MSRFVFALICFMLTIFSCGDGQKLNCKQHPLSCGDNAIVTCQIDDSPALVWQRNGTNFNPPLAFNYYDDVGKTVNSSNGLFVARLTKTIQTYGVTESVLGINFTNFDFVNISCGNVETLFLNSCVVAKPGQIPPENVTVLHRIETSCRTIKVLWNKPHHAPFFSIEYNSSLTSFPLKSRNANISDNSFNLTNMIFGVYYNFSVMACNCAGCGSAASMYNITINRTSQDVRHHLLILSAIKYDVKSEENGFFAVTLQWKEQDDSCALEFSVKIKNSSFESTNSTNSTSFTLPHVSRGTAFNISVAGVNGMHIGAYNNPPLCVYIQVPGKVVMNKPVFTMNYRRLQINWMPSRNESCTQPTIDYYDITVSYVGFQQSEKIDINNYIITLSGSESNVSVSVKASNIVGMGLPVVTVILIPPTGSSARLVMANFIIVTTCLLIGIVILP